MHLNVTDGEVLLSLLKQTCRKINKISADGAYETRQCDGTVRIKRVVPLIPPIKGATFWGRGYPRHLTVSCQKLYGSNEH